MVSKTYSAGAVKFSFWFTELRLFIKFLSEGKSLDEIKTLNEQENLFSASSFERGLMIYNTLKRRIESIDSTIIPLFSNLDVSNQKLVNLISIMAMDHLFFEFVYEVYRDKVMMGTSEITDTDYRVFFKNKQMQSEKVAKWTDQTLNRLTKTYKLYLSEAGVTNKELGTRTIMVPVIDPQLEQWLADHQMKVYLQALTGVEA